MIPSRSQEPKTTWFVYIVQCRDDSLYTGITTDLERRLREHNTSDTRGARYVTCPVRHRPHQDPATRQACILGGETRTRGSHETRGRDQEVFPEEKTTINQRMVITHDARM